MKKLRKDDEIIVIAGKDKGKRGLVLAFKGERVIVEGINLVKKHVKPNPNRGIAGGIESKAMPLHKSNVALVDANGRASRVGIKIGEDGKKHRFLKTTGAELSA